MSEAITTTYELNLAGNKIAQWTDARRKGPPPAKFVMIPKNILARPELANFSIRCSVVSTHEDATGYLVNVEAIPLRITNKSFATSVTPA